jgi:hypothetical protein
MQRKRRQGLGVWILGGVTVLLFIFITMVRRSHASLRVAHPILTLLQHLVIDIYRTYFSFTLLPTTAPLPGEPSNIVVYWETIGSFAAVFKTAIYNAVTLVSDLFIVYRCWAVWGRSYAVAALPFALFLADLGLAIWVTHSLTLADASDPVFAAEVSVHVKYFYVVTLLVNLLSTGTSPPPPDIDGVLTSTTLLS